MSTIGSSLVVPVVTRWNSLYHAVARLLHHKDVLNNLCEHLNLPTFSTSEIQYLESYKLLVEPIAEALDFLQGEQNIKFGYLLPAVMTLSNKLQKNGKKTEFVLKSVSVELEIKLRRRFSKYFDLSPEADTAITAAILTPNVKLNWLPVLKRISCSATTETIVKRALESILKFAVDKNVATNTTSFRKPKGEIDYFDFNETGISIYI